MSRRDPVRFLVDAATFPGGDWQAEWAGAECVGTSGARMSPFRDRSLGGFDDDSKNGGRECVVLGGGGAAASGGEPAAERGGGTAEDLLAADPADVHRPRLLLVAPGRPQPGPQVNARSATEPLPGSRGGAPGRRRRFRPGNRATPHRRTPRP